MVDLPRTAELVYKDNLKVSKLSGSKVEWVEEESYFFRLSKWEKPLLDFYEKNPNFISAFSKATTDSIL